MDQSDELALWSASAWLRVSGYDLQSLIVEDLENQVGDGVPLSKALIAISTPEQRAGDFGMEIAGTLLAPILVELLKDFWSSYLKKLGETAGEALANATTGEVKKWFVSVMHGKDDGNALAELQGEVNQMAARKRLSPEEVARLLQALHSPELPNELEDKK
jgi:hypothetical protein